MTKAVYNSNRTFLLDQNQGSLLLRGNEPFNTRGEFDYRALYFKVEQLVPNFDLEACNLITVSLLDNKANSEREDLKLEFEAFGIPAAQFDLDFPESIWPPYANGINLQTRYGTSVQGNPGSLIWYPVQGCTGAEGCSFTQDSLYGFSSLPDLLRTLLLESNTVIYFHCTTGNDRTGAVAASYLMKYKGATLQQVKDDFAPSGARIVYRDWQEEYENLIDWYSSTLP